MNDMTIRQCRLHFKLHSAGVTLLELMLTLAVAASIIVLGLSQYLTYRNDANVQDLKNNINIVFEAAARYYQANCRPETGPAAAGDLGPSPTTTPITTPYPITLSTLRAQGFLDTGFPKKNPLVNSETADRDYVVQFNQYTSDRMACLDATCTTQQAIGTIVIWKIQVSVNMVNAAEAAKYKTLLVGDCVSSLASNYVHQCVPTPAASTYIVFERLPSSAETTETRSVLAPSTSRVALQNQSGKMAGLNYLLNIDYSTEQQYFYCNE